MSDLLQSAYAQGRHPDADELSAFIENALPPHDRETVLAHLAVCRDCRETVAMSLPPAETPQEAVAPPALKRWFSSWSVFLPAAAALAGLGALIVYVNRAPQPGQTAQNQPPSARITAPRSPAELPAQQRSHDPGRKTRESGAARTRSSQEAATDTAQLGVPVVPASPTARAGAHNSGTVNVSNPTPTLPLETTSANVDALTMAASEAQAVAFKRALPSRLEALSVATHGRQVLAIDIRNAVFVSSDAGRHWETVSAPWLGRAVKASLATPIAAMGLAGGLAGENRKEFSAAASAAKDVNASLAGRVTDVKGTSISNATVVIFNSAGQSARTLKTDDEGRYAAIGLAGGSYNIEAQAPGFEVQRASGVAVDDSQPATVNLELRVAAAAESVTVEGAPQSGATRSAVQFAGAKRPAAAAPAIFEITTDNGDRWTSADGLTWQRK